MMITHDEEEDEHVDMDDVHDEDIEDDHDDMEDEHARHR